VNSKKIGKLNSNRIPEIDGLRAIALIMVLFYHFKFSFLESPGGYLGVDIFFVISGFVITRKIWHDLDNSTFRVIEFYKSRTIRLFPSFFLTLVGTSIIASIILLPDELSTFSTSYLSSLGLFSNIFFWRTTGYFNPSADFIPLIHIWSLSVEEQYYLIFPFFALFLFKSRKSPTKVISTLFISSLVLHLALANHFPVATFYLLPFRIWEFLFGSLIAAILLTGKIGTSGKIRYAEFLSFFAIATVVFLHLFSDQIPLFQEYIQLLAVLASGILLLLISKQNRVTQALNNRFLQSLGLASYSTYLVHQPVLVLWRHAVTVELNNLEKMTCLILTFVLGYGLSFWVEKPLRRLHASDSKNSLISRGFLIATLISIIVGAVLVSGLGTIKNYSVEQESILAFKSLSNKTNYDYGRCFLGIDSSTLDLSPDCVKDYRSNKGTIVIGDSHAAMISNGLKNKIDNFSTVSFAGCFALTKSKILPARCNVVFQHDLEIIDRLKPRNIVIAGNWLNGSLRTKFGERELLESLSKTVMLIHEKSPESRIFVVGNSPQWSPDLPSVLVRKNIALKEGERIFTPDYLLMQALDTKMERSIRQEQTYFINLLKELCSINGQCTAVGSYAGNLEPFVFDDSHTSNFGSALLADIIEKRLVTSLS